MYGIKVKLDESFVWMQRLGEYTSPNNSSILEFNTREEAELYAQTIELKNYNIEKVK